MIFLNAKSTVINEMENADIRDFLRAVSDIVPKERQPESVLGKQIADRMTGVKSNQEVRKKYMNTELYIYEEKKQARLEGMQEGMERGMAQGMERGMAQGMAQGMERGMAQGMERGRAEGIATGRSEGARLANEETARRLMAMNLSAADISKATGLTEEEIRALQ